LAVHGSVRVSFFELYLANGSAVRHLRFDCFDRC
jgi:hypothetical protein